MKFSRKQGPRYRISNWPLASHSNTQDIREKPLKNEKQQKRNKRIQTEKIQESKQTEKHIHSKQVIRCICEPTAGCYEKGRKTKQNQGKSKLLKMQFDSQNENSLS